MTLVGGCASPGEHARALPDAATDPSVDADVLCVIVAVGADHGWLPALADRLGIAPHVARVSEAAGLAVITGPRARAARVFGSTDGAAVVTVAVDGTL